MWPFKKTPKPPTVADRMRELAWENREEQQRRDAVHAALVENNVAQILRAIEEDAKKSLYCGQYVCDSYVEDEVIAALTSRGFHARGCGRVRHVNVSW